MCNPILGNGLEGSNRRGSTRLLRDYFDVSYRALWTASMWMWVKWVEGPDVRGAEWDGRRRDPQTGAPQPRTEREREARWCLRRD